MKPVWLLDVDGVLNGSLDDYTLVDVHVGRMGQSFPIRFRPEAVDKVSELSVRIDIHWLTTWEDDAANGLAPALGLPDFPVLKRPPQKFSDYSGDLCWEDDWWKYVIFRDTEAEFGPTIWTDDDISDRLIERHPDSLLIRPDSRVGLTDEDLERIEAWL